MNIDGPASSASVWQRARVRRRVAVHAIIGDEMLQGAWPSLDGIDLLALAGALVSFDVPTFGGQRRRWL